MDNCNQTICLKDMLNCSFFANMSEFVNATAGSGGKLGANITRQDGVDEDIPLDSRIGNIRIVIYSFIIIISFFGNGLLVLTMTLTKKMRTTTNYFLLSMAVGDLLVAIICAPYQLISWKFPSIKTFDNRICKSMPFLQLSTVGISIYTMVAIAFVRYIQYSHH